MKRPALAIVAPLAAVLLGPAQALAADDDVFTFVQSDRLEYAEASAEVVWDLQGWVGTDYHKLWLKAEGERDSDATEESELQVLYSRAHTPFFDLQIGLRQDFEPSPSRSHLVIGLQGLAPQWFEVDAALFLSDDGDLSARLEAEYDWLLTQRLVLQPRLEVELSADAVPRIGVGSGLVETELGLRLRYEIHRKFAPYVGVSWERRYGDSRDFAREAGEDADSVSLIAGLRLWF